MKLEIIKQWEFKYTMNCASSKKLAMIRANFYQKKWGKTKGRSMLNQTQIAKFIWPEIGRLENIYKCDLVGELKEGPETLQRIQKQVREKLNKKLIKIK